MNIGKLRKPKMPVWVKGSLVDIKINLNLIFLVGLDLDLILFLGLDLDLFFKKSK